MAKNRTARQRRPSRFSSQLAMEQLEVRSLLAGDAVATLLHDVDDSPMIPLSTTQYVQSGDFVYFVAEDGDGAHGQELWRTDGTPEGTILVKDIYAGSENSYVRDMTDVDGVLFFTADDGVHGRELWTSDGTPEGTNMVADLFDLPPYNNTLIALNGEIYFTVSIGIGPNQLWKSDGSETGTQVVRSVSEGGPYGMSYPANADGKIYFLARDDDHGNEIWSSDGTAEGTEIIRDIVVGKNGSFASQFVESGENVFFVADDLLHGFELWRTQGDAESTILLADISDVHNGSSPSQLTDVNGTLFFIAKNDERVYTLWKSDGTPEGTEQVSDIWQGSLAESPSVLTALNGSLLFTARTSELTYGLELWISDGTSAGTKMLKDVTPGSLSSRIQFMAVQDGVAYFTASTLDSAVAGLWRTDGTTAGTYRIADPSDGFRSLSVDPQFAFLDDQIILTGYAEDSQYAPWAITLSAINQPPVIDIGGPYRGYALESVALDASGSVDDADALEELLFEWDLDGDNQYDDAVGPMSTMSLADEFFPRTRRIGLKVTDTEGESSFAETTVTIDAQRATIRIFDPLVAAYTGTEVSNRGQTNYAVTLSANLGDLVFRQETSSWRWSIDTKQINVGTYDVVLTATNADGAESTSSFTLVVHNRATTYLFDSANENELVSNYTYGKLGDQIFFEALQSGLGWELWTSDGTPEGTYLLRDIYPGSLGSAIGSFIQAGDELYFSAKDASRYSLWSTDGNAVEQRVPLSNYTASNPAYANGNWIFGYIDASTSNRLWKSDGTPEGTVSLLSSEQRPFSLPNYFTTLGDLVYFTQYDSQSRRVLWRTDGTEEGTFPVPGVTPVATSKSPLLKSYNGSLYYLPDDENASNPIWKIDALGNATSLFSLASTSSVESMNLRVIDNELHFDVYSSWKDGYDTVWRLSEGEDAMELLIDFEDVHLRHVSWYTYHQGEFYVFGEHYSRSESAFWKTDGTISGTQWLADVEVDDLWVTEQGIYFSGSDSGSTKRLWTTDGTPRGTYEITASESEFPLSNPEGLLSLSDRLVFAATEYRKPRGLHAIQFAPTIDSGGPYADAEGATIQLDASGTTDDIDELGELTFEWDLDGDGQYDDAVGATPTLTLTSRLELQIRLRVTDLEGAIAYGVTTASIDNFLPDLGVAEASVTFDEGVTAINSGTFGDLGGDAVTVSASQGTIIQDDQTGTWTWSFDATDGPGQSQTVTITATDSNDAMTTVTFDLVVENVAPTATLAPLAYDHPVNRPIELVASATDPAGEFDTLTYSYAIYKQGAATPTFSGSGVDLTNFQFTPTELGFYDVVLTVSDEDGGSDEVRQTIVVDLITAAGSEFQVDTAETGQFEPSVAINSAGDYVIAWRIGLGGAPFAQRYNAAGEKVGDKIEVNPYVTNSNVNPVVAMDDAGNFIIAWSGFGKSHQERGFFAQRFSSAGVAIGDPIAISDSTATLGLSIALNNQGEFSVYFANSAGSYVRQFAADGTPAGDAVLFSTLTTSDQPSIALDDAGNYVLVWSENTADTYAHDIFGQRYSAEGEPIGDAFVVSTYATSDQTTPNVSMTGDGRFVVTWGSNIQDGSGSGIYAQRFAADGTKDGDEFFVNTTVRYEQFDPAVAINDRGEFVIGWVSSDPFSELEFIFAQRFATSPPTVISVNVGEESIADQGSVTDRVDQISLQFNERLATSGFAAITDFAHWRLELDGVDVTSRVTQITTDANSRGTIVTLQLDGLVNYGQFTLTLRDTATDLAGRSLDGDFDGMDGGDFVFHFLVDIPRFLGEETRVNTTTSYDQNTPAVATFDNGEYVVVWASDNQDGSEEGIFAQRFAADGSKIGGEIQVNSYTTRYQLTPTVAVDAAGNFVVAWHGYSLNGIGANNIYARRFSADGMALGEEFRVNTYTSHTQQRPSIAMAASGDFVIAWDSYQQDNSPYSIYAQRYAADGSPLGDEFRVNTSSFGSQYGPDVTMSQGGDFVITWTGYEPSGMVDGIYGQRFASDGSLIGAEFHINTYVDDTQRSPSVAFAANGTFVVTWDSTGQDGHFDGIYAQRYAADGTPIGQEFHVSTRLLDNQRFPSLAMDAAGNFIIVWHSQIQDGDDYGIFGQRYAADGTQIGGEFQINAYVPGAQEFPEVALDEAGNVVVVWTSHDQDGSGQGVYSQRFRFFSDAGGPYVIDNQSDLPLMAAPTAEGETIVSYTWDLDGDGQFDDASGMSPTITAQALADLGFAPRNTYEIYVRLTDNFGYFRDAATTVRIVTAAPTPIFESISVPRQEGTPIEVMANTIEPVDPADPFTFRYLVFKDGESTPLIDVADSELFDLQFTPADDGNYEIILTASAEVGMTREVRQTIVVRNLAPLLHANGTMLTVDQGGYVSMGGTFRDPGDDVITLVANIGAIEKFEESGKWLWSYDAIEGLAGPQTVTITATDPDGGESIITLDLTINNLPPTIAVDQSSAYASLGTTATITGTYSDPGDDAVFLDAAVGDIVDNLDGTWTWSLSDVQLSDSQDVTIVIEDVHGASSEVTFSLTILPQLGAYLTTSHGAAATDAAGEVAMLPADLESIHEWNTFTVNVWIHYDPSYNDDLNGIALDLNFNSQAFRLTDYTPSSGVGELVVQNQGDSLEVNATELSGGDVGQDGYFLVGSFHFGPSPLGGMANAASGAYPEPADLTLAVENLELSFDVYGDVPGVQADAASTKMQVVPYDSDDDGVVSLVDLAYFIRRIGNNVNSVADAYRFDYDRDEVVSLVDLAYLIRNITKDTSSGDTVVLPPPPSAATLESESVVFPTSTSPAPPQESATAITFSPLEGELIAPLPSSTSQSETANVDVAFGTLGLLDECSQSSTDDEEDVEETHEEERLFSAESWRPQQLPDWALEAASIVECVVDDAIALLEEYDEEQPALTEAIDWWNNRFRHW